MSKIYLDNNASTAIDPRVLAVVVKELSEGTGNPSSIHSYGRSSRQKLLLARQAVAKSLGAKTQEIIFTSGGTEGANLLLRGFAIHSPGHIITSTIEHACVYANIKYLESLGWQVTFLKPNPSGDVSSEAVQAALQSNTRLICLMAVNNETGVKTNIPAIATIAEEASIPFFVDGVALLGKEQFFLPNGVSAIFFSGHKIHAPKGIGFAMIRPKLKLQPLFLGGEQEYGRRSGSENLAAILGLAEAVRLLDTELPSAAEKMRQLRERFEDHLQQALPNIVINGNAPRISNTSNLCFLGVEGEFLLTRLDMEGIAVSHGSACSSGALEPSRVLLEMGLSKEQAASSIRFSFSRFTTQQEIDQALESIIRLVRKSRG